MQNSYLILILAFSIFSATLWSQPNRDHETPLPAHQPLKLKAQTKANILGARFMDVDGEVHRLGADGSLRSVVIVFLDTGCPISNRFAPDLNPLSNQAREDGMDFYGVISDPLVTWAEVKQFRDDHRLTFPVLVDSAGVLAMRLKPTTVPESFVVNTDDLITYRGRIDNRFANVGQLRKRVTSADLKDAMVRANDGSADLVITEPIGCIFESWDEKIAEPTYNRHIAPMIAANCVSCHRDGGVAPFSLESYAQNKRRARMMAWVVEAGLMPPWRADPEYSHFRDERVLDARQIALFRSWADSGSQRGDVENAPPKPKLVDSTWRMGEPDMVITMAEPFEVPASGEDIYRYFVLPEQWRTQKNVVGIDFQPGDASVVHHVNFFIDYEGKGRALDAADPGPGFSTTENGSFMDYDGAAAIGGWAPGADPYQLPEGLGMELPPFGDVVIEIHYHLSGKQTQDQSSIGFYFTEEPLKQTVNGLLLGTQDLNIPAGETHYWRHFYMDVPAAFTLIDIVPHMHYIGKEMIASATLPDGSVKPIIKIKDWDLRWQNIYVLRKPILLPAGSRINAWYRFDNSDANPANPNVPAKRIRWGWESNDEMCEIYLTIVPENPSEMSRIQRASRLSWYRSANTDPPPGYDR